ncbi:hypothetical protein KEM52_004790, partial [Ascosphaera acerosa]
MSPPTARLATIAGHLGSGGGRGSEPCLVAAAPPAVATESSDAPSVERGNYVPLSPTIFLTRAAEVEPDALAVRHLTSANRVVERTYQQLADRARGLAYHLKQHGHRRVGILGDQRLVRGDQLG